MSWPTTSSRRTRTSNRTCWQSRAAGPAIGCARSASAFPSRAGYARAGATKISDGCVRRTRCLFRPCARRASTRNRRSGGMTARARRCQGPVRMGCHDHASGALPTFGPRSRLAQTPNVRCATLERVRFRRNAIATFALDLLGQVSDLRSQGVALGCTPGSRTTEAPWRVRDLAASSRPARGQYRGVTHGRKCCAAPLSVCGCAAMKTKLQVSTGFGARTLADYAR